MSLPKGADAFAGSANTRLVYVMRGLRCVLLALAAAALACEALATDLPLQGIVFDCPGRDLAPLRVELQSYFRSHGVTQDIYQESLNSDHVLALQLRETGSGTGTLRLVHRKDLELKDELVVLPAGSSASRTVATVSKKEILLAMMQKGRATVFRNGACDVQALKDQVGLRQNIVAWAETLHWGWPDGAAATWNKKFWDRGNLRPGVTLEAALNDTFFNQAEYSIGCYTATKIVIIQATLDYYRRIKGDTRTHARIHNRLMADGEPLVGIEPGAMWYFEADSTQEGVASEGKLLQLVTQVPSENFIPGDWAYFLNTDAETYEKTGYEGSNALYLGRGKFDDYYADHSHSYTHREKLDEVYQWRNQVFSRERDVAKLRPLTGRELERLSLPPEMGGLQLTYRAVPYLFGFGQ